MSLFVDIEKSLADFHLRVHFESENETLALLGASGSGKSMTLRCIAGIERPDRGRIALNGRTLFDSEQRIDLPPQKRRVGYLFQQYALFPNMTVEENILCGVQSGSRRERLAVANAMLARLRLEGLGKRRPAALSGGQQQRVALARILVSDPEILLLDEPFAALDAALKWQLELELSDLLHSYGGGAVYVTHDRGEVARLCDSVCVLSHGRSEPKTGVDALFAAPATVSAARISGCKNFSVAVRAGEDLLSCTDWGVTLCTAQAIPQDVSSVGVRAHYLRFAAEGGKNAVTCTVERVIDNVFTVIVMLKTPGGGLLRMETDKDAWAAQEGKSRVTVSADPRDVMPLCGGN